MSQGQDWERDELRAARAGWPWPVRVWADAGLPLVFRADYDKPRRCPAWSGPALRYPRRDYGCSNGSFTHAYARWGLAANWMVLRCSECRNVRLPNFYLLTHPSWLRRIRDGLAEWRADRQADRAWMAARRASDDYIDPRSLTGLTVEEVAALAALAEYGFHLDRVDGRRPEETCVVEVRSELADQGSHQIWARTRRGRVYRVDVL